MDESRRPLLDLSSLEEGGDASALTLPLLPPSADRPNSHHDASALHHRRGRDGSPTATNFSSTGGSAGVPEEKTAGVGDGDGQVQGNGERASSGGGDNQASVGGAGTEGGMGEEAADRAKALAERRKSMFLVLLFCVSTGMQVRPRPPSSHDGGCSMLESLVEGGLVGGGISCGGSYQQIS